MLGETRQTLEMVLEVLCSSDCAPDDVEMPSKFVFGETQYKTHKQVEVGKFYFYNGWKPCTIYKGDHPSKIEIIGTLEDNYKYPASKVLMVVQKSEQSFVRVLQKDKVFWLCMHPYPFLIHFDPALGHEFDPEPT